jgi:hypothetical protein
VSAELTVERYEHSALEDWDHLVSSARGRHFMFERAYMDYHADRFDDASLIVLRNGRPLAALPASRHGSEVISHGGLTFGGLLSGPQLTTARAVSALDAVASALRSDGVRRLTYKALPHIYHLAPAEEDLFALHAAGARLVRREVSAAISAGTRPAYAEERRRAIEQGRRSGLVVDEDDRIEEYMALVREVLLAGHGVEPVHTPAEMRLLADRFPRNIRLFTASTEGQIVAGVLIYETPSVAHAQYIAVGPRGRELRANDAVLDHLLSEVYPQKWFDFGISNERDGALNAGLIRNKEGFGARAVVHDRYMLDLA